MGLILYKKRLKNKQFWGWKFKVENFKIEIKQEHKIKGRQI